MKRAEILSHNILTDQFVEGHTLNKKRKVSFWWCNLSQFSLKYKKRLLLRCIHDFKSDLIWNMDHMHISGTEPYSVILLPNKVVQKLKSDAPKVPNQAKAKRDGVINPKNYNFIQF